MTTVMSNNNYEEGRKFIWKTLNLFRGHFSMSEYDLFLYLLHSYKSGFLKYYNLNNGITIHDAIQHALFCDERNYPEYELKLFDNYSHLLQDKHKEEGLRAIYAQLIELNSDWFIDNWGTLFDDLIDLFTTNAGRYGEGIQMLELTKFIASICKYDGKGVLYNPFAGSASYGTEIAGDGEYFGQELNNSTWAIGVMRLLAHGREAFNYNCQDSIKEWGRYNEFKSDSNQLFDCIIATPPFGLRINSQDYYPNSYNRVEDFLVSQCLKSLTPNGTAITVLPQGATLWGAQSQQLRRQYVLDDKLDTVILLPAGAFCYSSIPAVILMFSNNKENPGNVRMVNGSEFIIPATRRNKINYDGLLDAINKTDPTFVKMVSIAEISNNDFNILPSIYFKVEEEISEGFVKYKLSDIASIHNGIRCTQNDTTGRVIKVQMLSDDPFHNTLDYDSIPVEGISNQYRKITTEVLLISKIRNLKPTLVHASEEDPIYINSNILALQITSPAINVNCLIYALSQITDLQVGAFIPNITVSSLRNMEIVIPETLSAQEAYFRSAAYSFKMAQVKEYGLEELISKQKEDFVNIIRQRKHDIGNLLKSANDSLKNLVAYLENKGVFTDYIDKDLDWKVSDCAQNLLDKFKSVYDIVDQLDDDEEYDKPIVIDLIPTIQELASRRHRTFKINFHDEISMLDDEEMDDENKHAYIQFGKSNLDRVFNNIIGNAEQHGFTDTFRTDYVVDINLSYDVKTNCYVIQFQNNGKPVPEGMDTRRYGVSGGKAGLTAGKGRGGAIVKNNIEHYKGAYSLISTPDNWFTVCIELKIPRYNG